jgi:hypothetical protein
MKNMATTDDGHDRAINDNLQIANNLLKGVGEIDGVQNGMLVDLNDQRNVIIGASKDID